jgi:DNA-directed RNA polymerase specialized sigma24 family protein
MSSARVAALLADADFVKSLRNVLIVRGVPRREVPDMIQESFAAAFFCRKLPASDIEARKYIFGIVRNKAKMLLRKWQDRKFASFDEDLNGGRDAAPLEERDLLQRIVAKIPDKRWQTFQWFVRVTFGDSLTEIADEVGVDYATAHARLARMRFDLRKWALQVSTGLSILLVAVVGYRVVGPHVEAVPPHPAVSVPAPVAPPPAPPDVAELRRRAFDACDAGRWNECQRDLDEAKAGDPAGESDERVVAARRLIHDKSARP